MPRLARQWLDVFGSKNALTRIEMDAVDPTAALADALVFRSVSDALPIAERVECWKQFKRAPMIRPLH